MLQSDRTYDAGINKGKLMVFSRSNFLCELDDINNTKCIQ